MEKSNIYWHAMSDPALLVYLGSFLKEKRLQRNQTQQEVATAAGVNRSTIVQIENGGGGTMLSFIQVLRALESLHLFSHFEVVKQVSPLQLAEEAREQRRRATKKSPPDNKKSSW